MVVPWKCVAIAKSKSFFPKAKNRLFWYFLSLVIVNATLEFEHKRNELCAFGSFNFFGEKSNWLYMVGSLDNFLFSGYFFLRHSEKDRVIPNFYLLLGTMNSGSQQKILSWEQLVMAPNRLFLVGSH